MDFARAEHRGVGRDALRVRPDPREGGLGRLPHHVAELPGEAQTHALAAGPGGGLDEQDVAPVRGGGQAHRDARHLGAFGGLGQVGRRAQRLAHEVGVDRERRGARVGGDAGRHLAHQARDVPVEIAHTPASRVYSPTTRSMAPSSTRTCSGRSPWDSSCFGIRCSRAIVRLSRSV